MQTPVQPMQDPGDDWLDRTLREDREADGYLDDAGFTARVMQTLPPPASAHPAWRRPVVVGLWGVAAAAAATALPGTVLDIAGTASRLLTAHPVTLSQIGIGLVALAATMWGAAVYTLRDD